MFDPTELTRVQTLCREIYRTNGEGRAAASRIDYNRNQFPTFKWLVRPPATDWRARFM